MANDDFSSQGLKAAIHYDEKTGHITRIFDFAGERDCNRVLDKANDRGYVRINLFGRIYGAHRLAWYYVHGRWPIGEIDHIDGNRSNNSIKNLREVSHSVNTQNQRLPRSGSASGFLGVTKAPFNKWMARIKVNQKSKYIGHFDTPELAHLAYVKEKRRLHPGCTI